MRIRDDPALNSWMAVSLPSWLIPPWLAETA